MRKWIADFSFMLNFTVTTMIVCNTMELKDITGIYLAIIPMAVPIHIFIDA